MQLISCHSGKIHKVLETQAPAQNRKTFTTGFKAWDELAPRGQWMRGAIHELLTEKSASMPLTVAMWLARGAAGFSKRQDAQWARSFGSTLRMTTSRMTSSGESRSISKQAAIVWCDRGRTLYPPAIANAGVDLSKLFLLRAKNEEEEAWALAEALRCQGVGAAIASCGRLTRVAARRFQLAAETGGSVGILMRPAGATSNIYAAATRWLVSPARGERTVQRWKIQLIHGHGGRVGQSVYLEHYRETNNMRAVEVLADSTRETKTTARASA